MFKSITRFVVVVATLAFCTINATAQFNLKKGAQALSKTAQALTLTDDQMTQYVKEYIDWMDKNNPVLPDDDPYTIRLKKLTEGLTDVDGLPLNFKVYNVVDVNAFACADGSVRVFAALMDIMSDEELLGVIGHEVGHVAHHDSKKAFKQALLTSALRDAVGATSSKMAALSDSQLGDLGEALAGAKYSQKQEMAADDYGYEFIKSHGKNPHAMAAAFKRLKELEGDRKTSKVNQLFSSHPDLDKRIERMTKRAKADGFAE